MNLTRYPYYSLSKFLPLRGSRNYPIYWIYLYSAG